MRSEAGILIVGGGLAGAAAAIRLARAGRSVTLVERSTAPEHKVCGEFLSHEALQYLEGLGVDVVGLGAVPIHTVGFAGRSRPLPFQAMSLTRRRLDEEMMRVAAAAGATVLRGCHVQSLGPDGGGWLARTSDGNTRYAPVAFLATGKHDLPGHSRPPGTQNGLVAFKMYFRLAPGQAAALAGRVELYLYRAGYTGLEPVEGGLANLCLLIDRRQLQRLAGAGRRWANLLEAIQRECPELRARLEDAEPMLAKPLTIASIPYGYVRPHTKSTPDGLWALGDQAAVIPSFTGDGMSIALHSGCLAAGMLLDGATAGQFQQRLRAEVSGQVVVATALSRGLVWSGTQPLLGAAVRLFPRLLGLVARATRLPAGAIIGHLERSPSTVVVPLI